MTDARGREGDVTLGIDLGTQGVRVVALDGDGEVRAQDTAPLRPGLRLGHRHEQQPEEWWAALGSAARSVGDQLGGQPVRAVAVSSTSGSVLVQTPTAQPVGPALMYDDARAAGEAEQIQQAGREVWSALGYRMQPSWALPKVLWLHRQGLLASAPPGSTVVHQADHVVARLVGHPVPTDTSHALKTGVDLRSATWPVEVLDRLGLDVASLPGVVAPGTPLGTVSAQSAEITGIPTGTTVVAGMTDGCAAQIAAGALRPGRWSSALGTTLVLKGSTSELLHDPTGAVYSHRNPDGGWLPGGASSTGARAIAELFDGQDLAELTRAAARHDPAPGTTYPLTGTGERFPFVAPQARGFWLDVPAEPAPRFAATLQGIALVERLAYDVLRSLGADTSGAVAISGGTARNEWWNQLRADLLDRPVVVPRSVEAAAGMAVLAAAPPGRLAETAERMVLVARTYQPDPERGSRYAQPYLRLRTALVDRGWLDPAAVAA